MRRTFKDLLQLLAMGYSEENICSRIEYCS